jgi:hypothetical protein
MIILSACTTVKEVPIVNDFKLSKELQEPCGKLPKLNAKVGDSLEVSILNNRAETSVVLDECSAKHQGVLQATGLKLTPAAKLSTWAKFKAKLPKPNKDTD